MRRTDKHVFRVACLGMMIALFSGCSSGGGEEDHGPLDLFEREWWTVPDESGITELLELSGFFREREWLITGMSSWFEESKYRVPGTYPPDSSLLGYYGVGNGTVFGFVGTSWPRNTMHGLIGPTYQKHEEGFFSDLWAVLEQDGELLPWKRDHIWKHRQAQIVMTRMQVEDSEVELDTVTFAPASASPGAERSTFVQVLNVRNAGVVPATGLSIRIQSYADADAMDSEAVYLDQVRDDKRMRVRPVDPASWNLLEQAEKDYPALVTAAFDLEPGAERQFVMVYEFVLQDAQPGAGRDAVRTAGWWNLLEETRDWWVDWHQSGLQIRTPDARVSDLIETLKGTMRVQTTVAGAITEMSHYTGTWNRDCFAPVRTWLKFGYVDEAWGIMDYYFKAASMKGGIGNALDTDIEIVEPLPEPDWYADMPFSGRLRGESPTYLALTYATYWRYTGEGDDIADRWEYVMHSLKGQEITDEPGLEGLMYFSGDETFRPQLSSNLGLPGGVKYPFEDLCYSANSAFLFVVAGEMLTEFVHEYGIETSELAWLTDTAAFVRQHTDQKYWLEEDERYSPFIFMETGLLETQPAEDVNTKPIWIGYLSADDERARQNMLSSIDAIGQENGILQNIPPLPQEILGFEIGGGLMTGMAPAYFLYNVAELDLPSADLTMDTVGTYVSPSGSVSEVGLFVQPEKDFCPLYFRGGGFGELYARYREWEGAILAEALMNYLVGFEADVTKGTIRLAPRLVHDSDWLEAENITFNRHRLSLRVTREDDGIDYTIDCPEDPASFGLDEIHLKLTVQIDPIDKVVVNGTNLDPGQYRETKLFGGRTQVRLVLRPVQGEMSVKIYGE